MFSVGDHVVHRVHGAGTVTEIREKGPADSGQATSYYIIELVESSIRLSVPVENAQGRLRRACFPQELRQVLEILGSRVRSPEGDAKRRGQEIKELLQEGEALATAQAIASLSQLERELGSLNATEAALLEKASSMLAGELALVEGIDLKEARYRVEMVRNA